jgi:hypothetical protein
MPARSSKEVERFRLAKIDAMVVGGSVVGVER